MERTSRSPSSTSSATPGDSGHITQGGHVVPTPTPNPALADLGILVGQWAVESPQFPEGSGLATFRWLEEGAYLHWRSEVSDPAPTSTWIIGRNEPTEPCTALYHDTRGVSRVYRMSLDGGVWKVWRDSPGFWQRFIGTLSEDASTIRGGWESSKDGSTWEHDFDLVFHRKR
jgi:hypothetical protein